MKKIFDYFKKTKIMKKISLDAYALKTIEEQTPEMCLEAVKRRGHTLQYVKEQTEEICLEAVKQDGHALRYVKEQTPGICLAAVKENGFALCYVKEQTKEICLAAVKNDGLALEHVKEQTEEICLEAVKQNPLAVRFAKKIVPEMLQIENLPDISKKVIHKYLIADILKNSKKYSTIHGDEYENGLFNRFRIYDPYLTSNVFAEIKFQKGPIDKYGANGCSNEDLVDIVIYRLKQLQDTRFRSESIKEAIFKLEEVLLLLNNDKGEDENDGIEKRSVDE